MLYNNPIYNINKISLHRINNALCAVIFAGKSFKIVFTSCRDKSGYNRTLSDNDPVTGLELFNNTARQSHGLCGE